MSNYPNSLNRVLSQKPDLKESVRGLPNLGTRNDGQLFSKEVLKILNVFQLYGNQLYKLENDRIKHLSSRSLGGGSPMKTKPFPPAKQAIIDFINRDDLSEYPMAAGDEDSRKQIVEYLKKEGFKRNEEITEDNIIFTVSSTEAFNMIMKVIARPYDIVLMTGPNYGLFTFVPERSSGATVEILPLCKEDNWYVNPKKLFDRIDELNKALEQKYKNILNYTPKVVAFLNENPHNPLGKVMSEDNKELLEQIGEICLEKGVFVIDDIIYRDVTYDRDKLAKPMATYAKYFDNTITLTGLSKSYGMASVRAGMVIANEIIIREIRNLIFQNMDSTPVLQGKALSGAFNASNYRYEEYEKYFNPIIDEYKYRLSLLRALVEGIDIITDKNLQQNIKQDIEKYIPSDIKLANVLEGINDVHIAEGTLPESGFFVLLDYTGLLGKKSNYGRIISSETELLKYMYEQEKIKLILGSSISWPNNNQLIGRVTTALTREDLVEYFSVMNRCLRKLI